MRSYASVLSAVMVIAALPLALSSGCKGESVLSAQPVGQGRQPGYPYVQPAPTLPGAPGGGPRGLGRPDRTPGTFTVVATGDVLAHDQVTRQARLDGKGRLDYRAVLADVKPIISSADLAICHLETPLAPPSGPFRGSPAFSVPPQIVDALADAGFDTCSTASNHALDQGKAGVDRTLAELDRVHIRHTGTARSEGEAAVPDLLTVRGVKVAHLAYSVPSDRFRTPIGQPWLANQIDPARILAAAHRARQAGADVVIVSMHWGAEYQHNPSTDQIALAQKLLADNDIDLIVGHHAHVVQPFARAANGKWVAYGLGNLVAAQPGQDRNEGVISRFTFSRSLKGTWSVSRAEFVPTFIDQGPPFRVINVPTALTAPGVAPNRRDFLQGIINRTSHTVYSRRALPTLSAS